MAAQIARQNAIDMKGTMIFFIQNDILQQSKQHLAITINLIKIYSFILKNYLHLSILLSSYGSVSCLIILFYKHMYSENDLLIIDTQSTIIQHSHLPIRLNQYDQDFPQQQTSYELQPQNHASNIIVSLPSIIFIISIIAIAHEIYLKLPKYGTQIINGIKYNVVPSAYPNDLTKWSKTYNFDQEMDEQSHISMFLPENITQAAITKQSLKQIQHFFQRGRMINQLQTWILTNIKGNQTCLIVWSDKLALSTVLLGQLLKEKGEILVLANKDEQYWSLTAFRQTIKKLELQGTITVLNTLEWILPYKMSSYDLIITSGYYFHEKIIKAEIIKLDVIQSMIEEQLGEIFYKQYTKSKFIIYYDGFMSSNQMKELGMLNNYIVLLDKADHQNVYSEISYSSAQGHMGEKTTNILIVYNQKIQRKQKVKFQQKDQNEINPFQDFYYNQAQTSQNQSEENLANFTAPLDTSKQPQVIRRISTFDIRKKIICTANQTKLEGGDGIQQSMFEKIKIIAKTRDGQEFDDYSHLAKFLASYYQTFSDSSSTFYCMQNQIVANIIAFISKKPLIVPYQYIKKQIIEQSLLLNHPRSPYTVSEIPLQRFLVMFQESDVKLMFAQLKQLQQWDTILNLGLKYFFDVIIKRKEGYNQINILSDYLQKGFIIYVIYFRPSSQFDSGCLRDYIFELADLKASYPTNSFYFITNRFINIDPYDPVHFLKTDIKRKLDILPYRCASPPYSVLSDKFLAENYVRVENKYNFSLLVEAHEVQPYEKAGAVDEDLIQFINSCFVSTQQIFFHSQALENYLLVIALAKKIQPYGQIIFTAMPQDRRDILIKNLQNNNLDTTYQILSVQSQDIVQVKQNIYFKNPTVIITTLQILLKYQNMIVYLTKNTLVLLKYIKDPFYLDVIFKLSSKYILYKIVQKQKIKLSYDRCQNYETVLLTPQTASKDQFNWFFFYV